MLAVAVDCPDHSLGVLQKVVRPKISFPARVTDADGDPYVAVGRLADCRARPVYRSDLHSMCGCAQIMGRLSGYLWLGKSTIRGISRITNRIQK